MTFRSKPTKDGYFPVNHTSFISALEAQFRRHAVLTWFVMPVCAFSAAVVIPALRTTCTTGFNNWTLIPILLMEAHHMYAENEAWGALRSMTTQPEWCVLRQLHVLRDRRLFVLLGVLEGLDLYTDVMFPWLARACDTVLTDRWIISWAAVPVIGDLVSTLLERFRFWGLAMLGCSFNLVVTGIWGLRGIYRHQKIRERWVDEQARNATPRLSAEVCFAWARSASTAMMPSVAMLCESLADQKKWVYETKDAKEATQGRTKLALGKIDFATQQQLELSNLEEQARVEKAAQNHYVKMLVAKVFFGNIISLWLQSSFIALTFEQTGSQARVKVVFSMVVSATVAVIRCIKVTGRIGSKGACLSMLILFFIAWTGAKVWFAYQCEDHLWNLTTGCVELPELRLRSNA